MQTMYSFPTEAYFYFLILLMIQERQQEVAISQRMLTNKTGLIFTLPQPIIYHKNNPYNITSERAQKNKSIEPEDMQTSNTLQILAKRRKKLKQKSRSLVEIERPPEQSKYQQKSVLRETLYRKFMEKTKYLDGAHQGKSSSQREKDRQREATVNPNVKLRQMNLVVLSKREELKREIKNKVDKQKQNNKSKEKEKQKATSLPRHDGYSLPHFARSRSSFYKGHNNEYTTLAFLSKTIFSDIQTHFTAHFPKQRKLQPFELGISKAKIVDKHSSRSLKNKRRSQQHSFLREYGSVLDKQYLRTHANRKWNKPAISRGRKRTELKGWDQQLPEYNIPLDQ